MKSIKSTFVRTLSLLLALIMVLNIPISAFATGTDQEISLLSYDYSAIPEEMLDNSILRALDYLGYDVDFLKSKGTLYKYITGGLVDQYPDNFPCPVPYCSDGRGTGLQTTTQKPSGITATSVTGKYPDLVTFKKTGLDCVDFAAYYLTNYLPNMEGADVSWLDAILAKYSASGYTYDNMYFWPTAQKDLAAAGVKIWKVNAVDYSNGEISKYTDSDGNVYTDNIYPKLKIGTLIQMGNESNQAVHYAIYAGTYDGKHYMIHSGSSDRGPEISIVEYMALYNSGNKKSAPLYFYDFEPLTEEQYGSITVEKQGPNGEMLAGAEFKLTNLDNGDYWVLTTDSTGTASKEGLPLGKYTLQETKAPEGYVLDTTVHNITLTATEPDVTQVVLNGVAAGGIQIYKYKSTGGYVGGAVFAAKNTATGEVTYRFDAPATESVTFKDPVTGKTVTVSGDGKANGAITFAGMRLAKYQVYEAMQPAGFFRDETIVEVELTTNGQVERIREPDKNESYTAEFLDAKVGIQFFGTPKGIRLHFRLRANHYHRPCRWYAQAPLGPFTSRAYRLIEFSFACVFCPTTANAVIGAPKAPLCKGSCQPNRLTEGLTLREQPLRAKSKILPTSPYTGEACRCGGTGHS